MIHRAPLPADVDEKIATLGQALEACPGVLFAYLFGSAARGTRGPLADVDVAVYLTEGMDPVGGQLAAIRTVAQHLGTDEVDVIILNTAPTALAGRILGGRRVLCDRDPFRRHRFESRALREFFDFRIFERRNLEWRFSRG